MKIKFQADSDLRLAIVRAVRRWQPAVDFQTADQAQLRGLSDEEVLARAASEDRILVSHDRRTMPIHFANFIAAHKSAGVILIPQRLPVSLAADELILIWEASEAEEWINSILSIPL